MYEILVWDERTGDFIQDRELVTNKVIQYATETEAMARATLYVQDGVQARVQFVRNLRRPRKTMKNGRVQRFRAVQFDGEWTRVVATVDSSGKKVKA